jgi:hypothetical protein
VTAQIWRADPATGLDYRDDDCCEAGNHRRDELCARTRLETLPPAEPEPDERGGAT